MSFHSERPASHYIGLLVAILVGGIAVRAFFAGGIEEYYNPSKRVENQIVAALEKQPGELAVLRAMQANFPLQYEKMLDTMTDAVSPDMDGSEVAAAGSLFLTQFLASHQNDFAAAPSSALGDVLAKETALLDRLMVTDTVACGDYVFGTLQVEDQLDTETARMLGESVASKVHAMAAGRADQQLRLKTTPRDVEALAAEMASQGASIAQIAAFLGGGDIFALSYDEQCDAAVKLVKSIDAQSEAREALLVATFLTPVR